LIKNARGRRLSVPQLGYSVMPVPDVGRMRIYEKRTDLGTVQLVAGAGEPLALVARAQRGVARAVVLAAGVVTILALLASYLAGARVSAPLRRMAQVATRVDAGDLDPRMEISGGRLDEVRVLAEAFNRMLDRLSEAFASQREFVADASHELRTPLTVISGQPAGRRSAGACPGRADGLPARGAGGSEAVRNRPVGRSDAHCGPPVRARNDCGRVVERRSRSPGPGAAQPRAQLDRAHGRARRPRAPRRQLARARPHPLRGQR